MTNASAAAARSLAAALGLGRVDPIILHRGEHHVFHLVPHPIVARVRRADDPPTAEVAIARHLAAAGAPVVAPLPMPDAGPHRIDGHAITLWPHVAHRRAADADGAAAAASLAAVHAALSTCPVPLPPLSVAIARCGDLLADPARTPTLDAAMRHRLIAAHRDLALAAISAGGQPLHGDAHLGNLLVTADAALWTDFEAACIGPREWDVACLPEEAHACVPGLDPERLARLTDLRSLCVATWCLARPAPTPAERAAIAHHLARYEKGRDRSRPFA